ncbi:hypothetical protein ANCCAN_20957 [Ancylostoma caninum]|uniref:Uncharacterized protein n=1 Tax=Ancylostoma caninum TaxID=29170 RepID=A0A368FNX3_ANCCA|nr:hypothetical protein ANCCAN_20957 [Ancylostoma caninum]
MRVHENSTHTWSASGRDTIWHSEIKETKPASGRIFRSFGQDLESVVFAVVAFLSGGVILFIGCFIVTKCFQFYKERVRRKRRRAMGVDDDELNDAVLSGAFDTEVCEEEESRLVSI